LEGPALVRGSISNTGLQTNVGARVKEDLVLASTSPWRRRMLESVGLKVRPEAPNVDERLLEAQVVGGVGSAHRAEIVARALALAKARAVAVRTPGMLVLGADQVGHDPAAPGRPFGKPSDPRDHLEQLRALVGRPHELVTAWALVGPEEQEEVGVARATLWMRSDLGEAELAAYVATGEGSHCAGGYAVEGNGGFLFDRIDGDWNTVIGLPLFELLGALRRRGWRYGSGA
jgi:septum formation protein